MKNRTQDEWRELFKQQANGDLSVATFCKEHNIGQSYFYKRKNDLIAKNIQPIKTSFIKVKSHQGNTTPITSIKLQHQQTRLILPINISPVWLAQFIKALA
ncbi:MAG: hypothetical protein COA86_04355 [Kangiella sp.]|nr:MAG: hypothetical protein COA86_18985 [Kangiella sp.]PHS12486.1 MAG: hypothetical protein COA86_18330 [Kangiella sp.]PHS13161.1 MAG: hypothetical protein COA86_17560 [Kangiella sp.]PHS19518.1 MAG: hypothetical protein COA86_04355 [Kangiella sp.]